MLLTTSEIKESDWQALRDVKQERGLKISVGLPARNESATVGRVLETVLACQMLVDEVMVFDSGSEDNTVAICRSYGLDVVADSDTATELAIPLARGKGWNLWSSIYHLTGDIVIWLDADIENIDRGFILGLVAPFLRHSQLKFVKGYYSRPKGGARVTELMARPLLNVFFPEAAGFVQPLAGEYAATRSFLEKAIFFSGYSIEVALLVQAVMDLSGSAVVQSCLGERIHSHQDIPALGRMSACILNTVLYFAERYGRLLLHVETPEYMTVFNAVSGNDAVFKPTVASVRDHILPTMASLDQYHARHQTVTG